MKPGANNIFDLKFKNTIKLCQNWNATNVRTDAAREAFLKTIVA